MTDKPNPADFSVDEKPGEYEITIRVEGEITRKIKADSLAHAKVMAEDMADKIAEGDEEAVIDDIFDVRVDRVRAAAKMFRVTRGGKAMQTSSLLPGDIPREPDERGF